MPPDPQREKEGVSRARAGAKRDPATELGLNTNRLRILKQERESHHDTQTDSGPAVVCSIAQTPLKGQTMQLIEKPEFTAAGITAALAADSADTAALIQDDELASPLVPFAVLVTNNSGKKVRAIGVRFTWKDSDGHPKGTIKVKTAMANDDDPAQLPSGASMLMTPEQGANHFRPRAPISQKKPQIRSDVQSKSDLAARIGGTVGRLNTVSDLKATLECVVFEDYSFLGSDAARQRLQHVEPRIH